MSTTPDTSEYTDEEILNAVAKAVQSASNGTFTLSWFRNFLAALPARPAAQPAEEHKALAALSLRLGNIAFDPAQPMAFASAVADHVDDLREDINHAQKVSLADARAHDADIVRLTTPAQPAEEKHSDGMDLALVIHGCHEQMMDVKRRIEYMKKCGEGTDQREWMASHVSLYTWAEEMTLPGDLTVDADAARPAAAEIAEIKAERDKARAEADEAVAEAEKFREECDADRAGFRDAAEKAQAVLKAERDELNKDLSALLRVLDSHDVTEGVETARHLKAELAALRQTADDGTDLFRVFNAHSNTIAGLQAVAAVALAQAIRRMEAVPVEELTIKWMQYEKATETKSRAEVIGIIRARLIQAAKGQGEAQPEAQEMPPIVSLNTKDCEPMNAEVAEAIGAMVKAVAVNEQAQDERQPDLSGESEKQAPAAELEPAAQPWTPAVGQTVRLKSGGPVMTVAKQSPVSSITPPDTFFCHWFYDDKICGQPFPAAYLTPATP